MTSCVHVLDHTLPLKNYFTSSHRGRWQHLGVGSHYIYRIHYHRACCWKNDVDEILVSVITNPFKIYDIKFWYQIENSLHLIYKSFNIMIVLEYSLFPFKGLNKKSFCLARIKQPI